jgi:hypothetical protein
MNRNAPFVLSVTCLVALALLALVWFTLGREALPGSAPPARTVLASAPPDGPLAPPVDGEASPGGPAPARVRAAGEAPPEQDTASPPPATVIGSLRIDGELQERGEVELRDAAGSWACKQPLNYDGKFRFDGVPSGDLALSFELSASAPRRLLVARIDVAAAPGEVAGLDLELETIELNVRVLGPGPGWSQAKVEI